MKKIRPTMLLILDGYGLGREDHTNGIFRADTPFLDSLFSQYPNTSLKCSGQDVGLPEKQMGNSEVGHLNIGAGRIIYQDLTNISNEIENGDFFQNGEIRRAMDHALRNKSALHLLGLLSDGGVHSHIDHIAAILDMAAKKGLTKVFLHCFLDGRDVPPRSASGYIEEIEGHMAAVGIGKIATLSGRYYAMDRDKHWDRIELAYDALTLGKGMAADSAREAIENSYGENINDEFLLPTVINDVDGNVKDNDSIFMFNFRPDRGREISAAFTDSAFGGFHRKTVLNNIHFLSMTQYDVELNNVNVAYPPRTYENTLGEYISSLGYKQLRIAETEKYAHVTFFFNGGVEKPVENEDRILIPSPKVPTFDLKPEMGAPLIADRVVKELDKNQYHLIVLNFANADMVGHTGNMDATIEAIQALDKAVKKVVNAVLDLDGNILLTADHGNADSMLDENGKKITAHSLNPVPLINISHHPKPLASGGRLSDIAPTLLEIMKLPKPSDMTGVSLIE